MATESTTETDTINAETIRRVINRRVRISYHTIGLGDGSEDEQERDTITGVFSGGSDTRGRTLRVRFECAEDGRPYYLFADEITSIEPL